MSPQFRDDPRPARHTAGTPAAPWRAIPLALLLAACMPEPDRDLPPPWKLLRDVPQVSLAIDTSRIAWSDDATADVHLRYEFVQLQPHPTSPEAADSIAIVDVHLRANCLHGRYEALEDVRRRRDGGHVARVASDTSDWLPTMLDQGFDALCGYLGRRRLRQPPTGA